ncbi:hypothetical protein [Pseudoalteromonas luteoviolacea]|uniref:Uncharacterized protein n=1 Tax=Pseudoalteromonas luteoviolacea S4060-1 TaxID=1365257 RepID=A0A162BKA4_9GAMM|nr:hypothetical protein [Pseudoalteromonas luteoviolacea]KZN63346.1 hypothetical protein N478_03590 [Pseudoalteromonas luteoviolacea S4060-1]
MSYYLAIFGLFICALICFFCVKHLEKSIPDNKPERIVSNIFGTLFFLCFANILRQELPKEGAWRFLHTEDELAIYKEMQEIENQIDNIVEQLCNNDNQSISC